MNAVLVAVVVMLALALLRVHVVLALFIGAIVGGLLSGLGLDATMVAFQEGLSGGAKIALSYALLGAFAMAVASAGLPKLLADSLLGKLGVTNEETKSRAVAVTKWLMLAGILAMAVMSQNLIPVHIAFIPLIIPPLLSVFNKLQLDRRLVTCILTFGLITTYMWIPLGFGSIFLNDILLGNIDNAGMNTDGINVMKAMGIPALGMFCGLLIAVFITYRKPREYEERPIVEVETDPDGEVSRYKILVSVIAIIATFAVQVVMQAMDMEADSLLIGALVGLTIFMGTGAVDWRKADDVFTAGMRMMALIGFIMITAQGFAAVMQATGEVESLVNTSADLFAGNKPAAALVMLLVGLVVTMGIGSSFSTLPIVATIYVPLCASMGFSPLATVAIVGTAGALGDAGSPASDSTLGPTSGLNADGQHDHIRDSVIPTFLHFNIPLLIAGWIAAMVL
ncbi:Na+/H+ antiporter family protein [Corynebacterium jeikeium]|uniref:Na+/H+ antiporter family protein n=1 Tax=Corynebacterium jeikeium TaxID=38289 RepID=UPI0001B717B8|nr:Na+/H+ antiporter NhaC family protein [Corynebacterium jeikeium]EEW15467.1 Na+/H+ antiporter family protein [Corynebacterium jeikeium ATCC 43734]OOD32406.1 sodium:proton antiporter [Corynebacterium jeikeium]WCZ53020.1 Na+/H+ antiporter family protein [Corynebacterium jeikeium]SUY81673.1 Na+/H+ antiporter NhaC [Corynebacterium jeikeium]